MNSEPLDRAPTMAQSECEHSHHLSVLLVNKDLGYALHNAFFFSQLTNVETEV
jgi:hypothetical protein